MKNYNKNIKDKEQKIINFYNKINGSNVKHLQKTKPIKRTRKNILSQLKHKGGSIKSDSNSQSNSQNSNKESNVADKTLDRAQFQTINTDQKTDNNLSKEKKLTLKNSDFVVWD
jgi:hypothetical protein